MRKEQEEVFWQTIRQFKKIGLLQHVMIIGSWAEYFYPLLFKTDFIPNIRTRDVDFFYRNINIPKEALDKFMEKFILEFSKEFVETN